MTLPGKRRWRLAARRTPRTAGPRPARPLPLTAMADARPCPSSANTAKLMMAPISIMPMPSRKRGCRRTECLPLGDPGGAAASAASRDATILWLRFCSVSPMLLHRELSSATHTPAKSGVAGERVSGNTVALRSRSSDTETSVRCRVRADLLLRGTLSGNHPRLTCIDPAAPRILGWALYDAPAT
jgi:hypothetical protein